MSPTHCTPTTIKPLYVYFQQVSEFADKLIQSMGGAVNDEDNFGRASIYVKNWAKLGASVQSIINITPYFSYLHGAFIEGKRKN